MTAKIFQLLNTGDLSMLKAEAQVLGCVMVELKDHSECSDIELLETYAEYHKEIGETSAAIRDALKNRTISKVDYDLIEKEAYEDVTDPFLTLISSRAFSITLVAWVMVLTAAITSASGFPCSTSPRICSALRLP